MSEPNIFGSDKWSKWSDNVRCPTIISNTARECSISFIISSIISSIISFVFSFLQPIPCVLVSPSFWYQCSQVPTTLHTGGKREGQPLVATGATGRSHSRLFYIKDHTSGLRFLVDTGAEVSVLPPSGPSNSSRPTGYNLKAANGSTIATFGTRSLTPDLGLRRSFRWVFVIASVRHAILGADFLHHFGLSVDVRTSSLIDTLTQLQVNGISTTTTSASPTLPCLNANDPYASVLAEFPNILHPRAPEQPVQHSVTHHIRTTGPLVSARPRRLPPDRLCAAKQEFNHMLDLGVIRPSSSCWSSPLPSPPGIGVLVETIVR